MNLVITAGSFPPTFFVLSSSLILHVYFLNWTLAQLWD